MGLTCILYSSFFQHHAGAKNVSLEGFAIPNFTPTSFNIMLLYSYLFQRRARAKIASSPQGAGRSQREAAREKVVRVGGPVPFYNHNHNHKKALPTDPQLSHRFIFSS
jgi:hypothetical protein